MSLHCPLVAQTVTAYKRLRGGENCEEEDLEV